MRSMAPRASSSPILIHRIRLQPVTFHHTHLMQNRNLNAPNSRASTHQIYSKEASTVNLLICVALKAEAGPALEEWVFKNSKARKMSSFYPSFLAFILLNGIDH